MNTRINGKLSNFAIKICYFMDSKELLSIISDIQASPKDASGLKSKRTILTRN
jgi:hypothetical protein